MSCLSVSNCCLSSALISGPLPLCTSFRLGQTNNDTQQGRGQLMWWGLLAEHEERAPVGALKHNYYLFINIFCFLFFFWWCPITYSQSRPLNRIIRFEVLHVIKLTKWGKRQSSVYVADIGLYRCSKMSCMLQHQSKFWWHFVFTDGVNVILWYNCLMN